MKKIKISEQEDILIFLWRTYGADDVNPNELTEGALELRSKLRNLVLNDQSLPENSFEEMKN